jgi:hypothetical protein
MADLNFEKIRAHYEHAKEAHPYFCDGLTAIDLGLSPDDVVMFAQHSLDCARNMLKSGVRNGDVLFEDVLDCEVDGAIFALAHGDKAAAREEIYDAIAVLLRVCGCSRRSAGSWRSGEERRCGMIVGKKGKLGGFAGEVPLVVAFLLVFAVLGWFGFDFFRSGNKDAAFGFIAAAFCHFVSGVQYLRLKSLEEHLQKVETNTKKIIPAYFMGCIQKKLYEFKLKRILRAASLDDARKIANDTLEKYAEKEAADGQEEKPAGK